MDKKVFDILLIYIINVLNYIIYKYILITYNTVVTR